MGRFERTGAAISDFLGLDDVSSRRPRHLRWLPILPLLLALLGFVTQVSGRNGEFLSYTACTFTLILMGLGPLREATRREPLDEREKLLRMRAMLVGANSVVFLAIAGTYAFAYSEELGIWKPATWCDWAVISFTLLTIYGTVPILHASWTTRPLDEQGE